jgi:hypothetical protein
MGFALATLELPQASPVWRGQVALSGLCPKADGMYCNHVLINGSVKWLCSRRTGIAAGIPSSARASGPLRTVPNADGTCCNHVLSNGSLNGLCSCRTGIAAGIPSLARASGPRGLCPKLTERVVIMSWAMSP